MIIELYSIRDLKSDYQQVYCEKNNYTAQRSLTTQLKHADDNVPLKSNPEDYQLFHVGTFDTETGSIINTKTEFVVNLSDLVSISNTQNE